MSGLVFQNGFQGEKAGGLVESGDLSLGDFREFSKGS